MILTEKELIQIRRHLHQIPELALKEFKTHDYLLNTIRGFNQDYLKIEVPQSLPIAILVLVKGKNPQRTIGYRADIDALPVNEKTNLPYASKNPNVMHACGHDIHMTVALGLLNYFSENQPQDNLLFFFQPAEESESGGKHMKKEFFMMNLNRMNFMVYMTIQLCQQGQLVVEWGLCLPEPLR